MERITDYPLLVFTVSIITLWLATRLGGYIQIRHGKLDQEAREDFGTIQAVTLTLLALIIGFSFSLAANRYNTRRNFEEAEANAIGTEYVRADLLPAADVDRVRALLRDYLAQRIAYYQARDDQERRQANAGTADLQSKLWSAILVCVKADPSRMTSLAVSAMNDVLNSQGWTQAEFWNRIPKAAWILMVVIAIGCNLLVGYGSRSATARTRYHPILPLVVSIAFMLIADIDSPRHGIVLVKPLNLISLSESLRANPAEQMGQP